MRNRNRQFYVVRIKNASLSELAHRAKEALLIWRLKLFGPKASKSNYVPQVNPEHISNLELPDFDGNIDIDQIEEILDGKIYTLNTDKTAISGFEKKCISLFFCDVRYADENTDIRSVWEPARLQHISILLISATRNFKSSLQLKAKDFAKATVVKWIKDNPFLFGPHYISVMECGLRIPVLFYCLKIIDDLSPRERELILETIYLHAWWISKRLSLYSSIGNHTIAECVGLIFAGAIFGKTRVGKEWIERGVSLLRQELPHQVLKDGGPAEQSFNYHRFVLDLYWLSINFLERNNLYKFTDIKVKLMRAEYFLDAFRNNHGNLPAIGDSDDGHAIAPGISPKRSKIELPTKGFDIFRHSGYTVIRAENSTMLTFDHGPLGMPPLYNHGHADALSITLSKNREEILVDSGTYRYNGETELRRYFKGTRAHNTVTVDQLDQAIQVTSFIWSGPYDTKLIVAKETNDGLLLKALHNGYSRLPKPVWHKRAILFFDKANFIIKDYFEGKGVHDFELNYHLHPAAVPNKNGSWWHISKAGVKIFMALLGDDDFLFADAGQDELLLGWNSPSYGVKMKSPVLSCTQRGLPENVIFVTAICTKAPPKKDALIERFFGFEKQN